MLMHSHEPFHYRTTEELLEKAAELGVDLPHQTGIDPLFQPLEIHGVRAPNRIAVQPMEGCDGNLDGAPDALTFRRYRRYAQGGNGLIWFEACSVSPTGRSNPRQLHLSRETLGAFRQLVESTRKAAAERLGSSQRPYFVLQLTHSGRRSMRAEQTRVKVACFNPLFDGSPDDVEILRDEELLSVGNQFVTAAALAFEAGFDAVDVKACHGYLLHELLSAFTRSESAYGGGFEGRTRLLLEIVRRIRETAPELALAVRMNATDAIRYPYGFGVEANDTARPDLAEPLRLQQLLKNAGCTLFNVTAGIPAYAPYVGRPFNRPARGNRHPESDPLEGVCSLIAWAAAFQRAQPSVPVVGTGYSWLRQFWPHVGAAVIAQNDASFIGLGRGSFAYPDAPLDLMEHGRLDPRKCCIACSCCSELMRSRSVAGCVLRDPEIYRPAYKNLREVREGR